jgi:hypothetical protein
MARDEDGCLGERSFVTEIGGKQMSVDSTTPNDSVQHWVVGRPESSGQFTVEVVGVPELRATAATRAEAIERVRAMLSDWLATGQLMSIEVPRANPLLHFPGHLDPNDPLEQEFLKELAQRRRDDLDHVLREGDQKCPNSSSIPTT